MEVLRPGGSTHFLHVIVVVVLERQLVAVGEKFDYLKQAKKVLVCIVNAQMTKTRLIEVSEGQLHIGNQGEEGVLELMTRKDPAVWLFESLIEVLMHQVVALRITAVRERSVPA